MASMDSTGDFDETTMEMLSANLPSSAFTTNTPDPRLERARQETERTNQITPLLKEELRLRILSKRHQKGEPEIETNSGEPRNYELTEEEKQKRERRRAQNRCAAKKCRHKRKMKTLSDAEKFRVIREQNQQLRNDVMYLQHKEEIYKKFCLEHILYNQCSSVPDDESSRRKLLTLMRSKIWREQLRQPAQVTATSSFSRSDLEAHLYHSQPESTTSSSAGLHSNFQNQGLATCSNTPMTISSTAAQAIFRAEQNVHSMEELKELPVHEISCLLPPEPDFCVSDHSQESTLPGLSPAALFSTLSPMSVGGMSSDVINSSYFSQLTPSTPFSGNNTGSFSSSNDEIFSVSRPDNDVQLNSKFLDSSVSSSDVSHDISMGYSHSGIYPNDKISRQFGAASSHVETLSTPGLNAHIVGHSLHHNLADTSSHSVVSGSDIIGDDRNAFPGAAINNNVILNTAILGVSPNNMGYILNNYLSVQNLHGTTGDLSSCDGEFVAQTVPISPLTPLSPPSPYVTHSPLSPSSLAVEISRKDCIAVRVQSFTGGAPSCHSTGKRNTPSPARPFVRRASSTASVPSPCFNHLMSIALSPPPSVPSPTGNGIPESPPILTFSATCDENTYAPHFSPISATTSTDRSPVRLFDMSEEEFN